MTRKYVYFIAALVIFFTAFALPMRVSASSPAVIPFDKIVFGGNYVLSSGDTLDGTLAMFGGNAIIEEDATVNGDVMMMGGNLSVDGAITGSIVSFGGSVSLGQKSVVEGDVNTFGGLIQRANGSQIQGEVIRDRNNSLNIDLPENNFFTPFQNGLNSLWDFSMFLARTLAMAALALLIVLAAPKAATTVSQTAFNQPVIAGGLGLMTIIVAPIALVLMAITILLIPVSLIGILLVSAAFLFGYVAIGLEVGKRLELWLKGSWSDPLSAGIGTFVLGLGIGLLNLIPCVGWILTAGVGCIGIGAVLLTRFGSIPYYPSAGTPAAASPLQPPVRPTVVDVYPAPEPPQPPTSGGEEPSASTPE